MSIEELRNLAVHSEVANFELRQQLEEIKNHIKLLESLSLDKDAEIIRLRLQKRPKQIVSLVTESSVENTTQLALLEKKLLETESNLAKTEAKLAALDKDKGHFKKKSNASAKEKLVSRSANEEITEFLFERLKNMSQYTEEKRFEIEDTKSAAADSLAGNLFGRMALFCDKIEAQSNQRVGLEEEKSKVISEKVDELRERLEDVLSKIV